MTSYRIEYTEHKPGGYLERQCDRVVGDLETVRTYLDNQDVWAADPIVITEYTQSDGRGRIVPASEWDVC
jgi:hypothetical protein